MRRILAFIALLTCCGLAGRLPAQRLSATLRADTATLRIGEPLHLTLSVPYDPALIMDWPDVAEGQIGRMDLIDRSGVDTIGQAGRQLLQEQFTVMAFDSGRYALPGMEIRYRRPDDTASRTLRSNDLAITVFTVPVDTTQDIRPLKALAETPVTWQEVARLSLLGLLVLAVLGALIWWWRQRANRPAPAVLTPPPPPVPPADIAMREIARLEAQRYWQQGEVKAYYAGLSDILRVYMEAQFHFPAMESVTHTILHQLTERQLPAKQVAAMRHLLEQADLAKFAKFRPETEENLDAIEKARDFVKSTKNWGPAQPASADSPQAETPAS